MGGYYLVRVHLGPDLDPLESVIAGSSAGEIVAALGLANAPRLVRATARAVFARLSARLGRVLARFDRDVARSGLPRAAAVALEALGATWTRTGAVPGSGPLLVVANHPGAYDALVLFAAMGRRDALVLVDDRSFLRALPALTRHLEFLPPDAIARMRAVRRAHRHVADGGALLHFGAGRIEPDPAFARAGQALGEWGRGSGALVRGAARTGGVVVPALVEGVHSERAKRLWIARMAERRGVTTLAPLLQVAVPAYRRVAARVHFGAALDARCLVREASDDAALTARVRGAARVLHRPRD
jgi:hypothetical protein